MSGLTKRGILLQDNGNLSQNHPRIRQLVVTVKGIAVFTILTRSLADSIAFIHDRMPVILPDDVKADWLNPKYVAEDLIRHAATDVQFQRV